MRLAGSTLARSFAVLAALTLFLLPFGCAKARPSAPSSALDVKRIEAPKDAWSPGAAGVYVEVRGTAGAARPLEIPLRAEEVRFLDASSLRLGRWDAEKKRFDLVKDARFDPKTQMMRATASSDGTYGVYGYSRWSHVRDFQRRLCERGALGGALSEELLDRLCLVILCPAFDARAWSEAWRRGAGESIPPEAMDAYFGDLCSRCTGGFRPEVPECEIGVIVPDGSVPPPELEPIPNGIANGGRAVAIAVHPTDQRRMVVASETGGMFASTDDGVTWTHVSAANAFDYSDVQYLPTDPNVVVASAHRDTRVVTGGGIWRSADGGRSWTQMTLSPPRPACTDELGARALDYEGGDARLWTGTTCGVARSDDGTTWSYLPAAAGYDHDKTYAIEAPSPGHLKILTDAGVKVTTNGGGDWSVSTTGLPTPIWAIGKDAHNQIALSPLDANHIYWSFAYWLWDATAEEWNPRHGLYLSTDNGSSWAAVLDEGGLNRPPFVRVARALSGTAGRYDLYYGDGGCALRRSTVTHGPTPTFSAWTTLNADHCDASDVAFGTDGATPVLLASDGGLHKTADAGLNWTFTGGGSSGYNALQITEVTGQKHASGLGADLYFATQDNDIWASADLGRTWPGRRCCEGFFLGIPRESLPAADTRLTGVSCAGCGNFISEPLLRNQAGFPNPPNDAGNPKLVKPAHYIQNTRLPGVDANLFNLSDNTGGSWTPRYGFPEPVKALSEVSGPPANPTIFTAFKRPGTTPSGEEWLGVKRITDVLGTGTPVVSEVTGFGSLGIFPTMFAWYKPFGAAPNDPNFMVAPDIVDQQAKVSRDGGAMWTPDAGLTSAVTRSGTFRFNWGPFVQVASFGFDPECSRHILVGTFQAGVLRTLDGGTSWHRVPGSEVIPRVSSFFFTGGGEVILSSYGRGLWKLRSSCRALPPALDRFRPVIVPIIYIRGVTFPLRSMDEPCPKCTFFLADEGEITDYATGPDGEVTSVVLSRGGIRGYTGARERVPAPFAVGTGDRDRKPADDETLEAVLAAGNKIQGLYLEGKRLKGLLLGTKPIGPKDLPAPKRLAPYIVLRNVSPTHGVGARRLKPLDVVGYGFDPRRPLEITIDGRRIDPPKKPVFDQKGVFRVTLPLPLHIGGHTLRVKQKTPSGTLEDAYTFNVTVEDGSEDRGAPK